jgi:hypothetical protein|nr:MAG TPA: hypothetical protein [Caudoviricetes sp.]
MFIKKNMNPYNKCIDDCAIRAIALATKKDYMNVMDGLIAVADEHNWEIDELRTINKYLTSIGWEFCELKGHKPTVKQFATTITYPRIVIVNGHATFTKNGNTYDTWNCNRYRVNYVYRKRNS